MLHPFRLAARSLARSPGFTAVAVLTLALGLGAAATVAGLLDAILLTPLGYPDEDRVVALVQSWEGVPDANLSQAEFFDYLEGVGSFADFGVYGTSTVQLAATGEQPAEQLRAGWASPGVLPVLGATPVVGRVLETEDMVPGSAPVALLGHDLWRRRFGSDPAVVGRALTLDGASTTVVGVLPKGFRLPEDHRQGVSSQLLLSLQLDGSDRTDRGSHFLAAVGRLAPGLPIERAHREAETMARSWVERYPDEYDGTVHFTARVVPVAEPVVGDTRPLLLTLAGAALLVLLIGCANVASLLYARGETRRGELAIHNALGAGRGRLLRQALAESVLLAGAAAVLGTLAAAWATSAVVLLHPPDLPRLAELRPDATLGLAALALALVTALAAGLAPALRVARAELSPALRGSSSGGGGPDRRGARSRDALVVATLALSLVLLTGAGLLLRSFAGLLTVDAGIVSEGVLTAPVAPPSGEYSETEIVAFYDRLGEDLRAAPGVTAAGAVARTPLSTGAGDLNFEIEGRPVPPGTPSPVADWQVVTPGAFEALGMRRAEGRFLDARDHAGAPGAVVLNRAAAERYWPGESPVGARFRLGGGAGPGTVTVVGVVDDVRYLSLGRPAGPEMYLPHAQFRFWGGGGPMYDLDLVVRSSGDPSILAEPVRRAVAALDPGLPVPEVTSLDDVVTASLSRPRFLLGLVGVFAALALVLAAVGLYALLAHQVARRSREIGVRMALGARPAQVSRRVVGYGVRLAALGLTLGVVLGALLLRVAGAWTGELLFEVSPGDPLTLVAVAMTLLAVATLAAWLPARRAARVDPARTLREG